MILCANPAASYRAHRAAIAAAVQRVLDSGRYILAGEVAAFEADFAGYLGVQQAVGVGNGTDALYLALRACEIGPGDEVITVAHTASATAAAIRHTGATPVFVDIEPDYFTLDPASLPAALTPRTRAILPVHLYGQPAALEPMLAFARSHGLRVIEDCAQATGASWGGTKLGTLGDLGCFSFYPTKNLGALGDGGMVVTNNTALAARLRALRQYGWNSARVSEEPGINSRLDELQAGILRAKLPFLDADNAQRLELATRYDQAFSATAIQPPARRANCRHVFHLYVVRTHQRDQLLARLQARGIGAAVHYPVPLHQQPAYRQPAPLPHTESAAAEVLTLPLYPELTTADQDTVIAGCRP